MTQKGRTTYRKVCPINDRKETLDWVIVVIVPMRA